MVDIFENGINGATGDYLFPPLPNKNIAAIAKKENAFIENSSMEKQHLNDLKDRARELRDQSKAPAAWVDPTNLANAGWGVIFAQTYRGYSLEALKSENGLGLLLNHRQQQASQQVETYYREYVYKSGQSKNDFLKAYKVPTSGAVDPNRGMPYYLMIVGDPETIPYEFQYQLDVQYAVGRIYFDTLEEYAYYAQSVVRAEKGQVERPRQVSFWGVRNQGDQATKLSSEKLIKPLSDWLSSGKASGWEFSTLLAEQATKENLSRQINQGSTPAILFTASHGMGFPKGDSYQKKFQGSLVCQEWKRFSKFDPETQVFSAADIKAEANFHGLITFHFACYGLGTPQFNDFKERDGEKELAEAPFIARLPQQLLSHAKGGALAVIGHVDRAFANSFQVSGIEQLTVYQSFLNCLIAGHPVGYAIEFFNQQYAELASDCNLGIRNGNLNDKDIAALWTRNTNARNYAIFGDPAVRIAVSPVSNQEVSTRNYKVWFQRSNMSPEAIIQQLNNKIKKLEQQVEALQAENQQLREQLAKSQG